MVQVWSQLLALRGRDHIWSLINDAFIVVHLIVSEEEDYWSGFKLLAEEESLDVKILSDSN